MSRGKRQTQRRTAVLPSLDAIYLQVASDAERVSAQGEWPSYIPPESLLERLPLPGETSSGFDAGIACALDLIPRERQTLASKLHAAYTPEAMEQVRRELSELDPDAETTWWLAACSVCDEDSVDQGRLTEQLATFAGLAADPDARQKAARACFKQMVATYELRDGVPYGEADGCMHGAYIDGHDLATMRAEIEDEEPLYFIGTFQNSLGLEDFSWSAELDSKGRPRSGPVHGSRQYVKATDAEEFARALAIARDTLARPATASTSVK